MRIFPTDVRSSFRAVGGSPAAVASLAGQNGAFLDEASACRPGGTTSRKRVPPVTYR